MNWSIWWHTLNCIGNIGNPFRVCQCKICQEPSCYILWLDCLPLTCIHVSNKAAHFNQSHLSLWNDNITSPVQITVEDHVTMEWWLQSYLYKGIQQYWTHNTHQVAGSWCTARSNGSLVHERGHSPQCGSVSPYCSITLVPATDEDNHMVVKTFGNYLSSFG